MLRRGVVVSIDKSRSAPAAPVGKAVLQHLDGLYRFALRLTRDTHLAQELTQESALRALEQKDTAIRDLRAWLFQALYHTFVSHYRHSTRQKAASEDFIEAESNRQSFSRALPDQIAVEDVRSAIDALPPELRAVVWLSDAEEFRLREISEMLGWPLGTVASRLWRARQELRRLLSAYGAQGEKQA